MHYHIYEINNIIDGLSYVGCTADEVQERWSEHIYRAHSPASPEYSAPLYAAIRRYGEGSFTVSGLEEGDGEYREMLERERYWMVKLGSVHPCGYNKRAYKLSNEEAAIIRYDAYGLTRSEYAKLFGISLTSITQIRNKPPYRSYRHITQAHLLRDVVGYAKSQRHISVVEKRGRREK